jgi:hypothetical protein
LALWRARAAGSWGIGGSRDAASRSGNPLLLLLLLLLLLYSCSSGFFQTLCRRAKSSGREQHLNAIFRSI